MGKLFGKDTLRIMKTLNPSVLMLTAAAFALSAVLLPGASAQKRAPAKASGDILTIINSGDRLSPGYRVTVSPAGAVHGVVRTRRGKITIDRRDQMIAPTRDRLFQDLKDAEPLNRLGTDEGSNGYQNRQQGRRRGSRTQAPTDTGRVIGPQVYVLYRGVRSPNLRAAGDDTGKELYQRVKQVIEVVRLPIPDVP